MKEKFGDADRPDWYLEAVYDVIQAQNELKRRIRLYNFLYGEPDGEHTVDDEDFDEIMKRIADANAEIDQHMPWLNDPIHLQAMCEGVKACATEGFSIADLMERFGWEV